jgi:protein subunit release factor B
MAKLSARNYVEMCNRLYEQACEYEGIDPEAGIVDFSDGNSSGVKYRSVFNQEKYDEAWRLSR